MPNRVTITWEEFEKDIKELAQEIHKKNYRLNKILCITKGGLIPAYYLAKELGIKYIETLCVSSYEDDKKSGIKVMPFSRKKDSRHNWLVVDDLVDTGETMEVAKKYYPNSKVAVLYKKIDSPEPDFFVSEKEGWVVFPWE